ncbi:hypothetical protein GALL_431660 [mine drainage metagenome]|uniref:Uncharacterized protein n=1 Tax=mine drainage metagenome TaxID=410659 RepID=A0A1J5PU75_9ZZZZ
MQPGLLAGDLHPVAQAALNAAREFVAPRLIGHAQTADEGVEMAFGDEVGQRRLQHELARAVQVVEPGVEGG